MDHTCALPDTVSKTISNEIVEVMLDETRRSAKPPKGDWAWREINKAVSTNRRHVTVGELATLLTQGCTFAPGVFRDGKRSEETWTQQQVFALDFDNDKPGNSLTPEVFLRRCEALDVHPAFVYPSFSDSPQRRKFRAVFVNDTVVEHPRLRVFVQTLLMEIFSFDEGTPDPNCRDGARLFLGTNRKTLHENHTATVNPVQLFEAAKKQLLARGPAHFARDMERLCARAGLAHGGPQSVGVEFVEYVDGNGCATRLEDTDGGVIPKMGDLAARAICTIAQPAISPKNDTPHSCGFCHAVRDGVLYRLNFSVGAQAAPQQNSKHPIKTRACAGDGARNAKRRVSVGDRRLLLERCRLLREFINGERKLGHLERRLLLTNLTAIKGGEEWFREGLRTRRDYTRDTLVEDVKRYRMKPEGCSRCPFAGECDHRTNLLQQMPMRRRECRQTKTAPQRKSLKETRTLLQDAIDCCFDSKSNKVFVIKCDTGVGKTEELLRHDLEGVCVAFDTHRLKSEAHNRLRRNGQKAYLWPEPPELPKKLGKMAERRYAIGAGGVTGLYKKALVTPDVLLDAAWGDEIKGYLKSMREVHGAKSVFATHEKAYQLQHGKKLHTVVFDEDPAKTLVRVEEINLGDARALLGMLEKEGGAKQSRMAAFLKTVLNAPSKVTHRPAPLKYSRNILRRLLLKTPKGFASRIESLFSCAAYRKDSIGPDAPERIYCVTRQHLREDKKYIILSATADEMVYRRLFGERLEFINLTGTDIKGKLACHTGRSYSKTGVMEDPVAFAERVQQDMADHGFEGIITHKFCAEGKPGEMTLKHTDGKVPVFGTFGGLQGLDSFGGKNIAVYGTPYPPEHAVRLWAALLGIGAGDNDYNFSERVVEFGEFEVSTATCSDNSDIQRLYLWLTHSEIIQAVGRARLVNNDCTVHVFAKLPVSGCVLEN